MAPIQNAAVLFAEVPTGYPEPGKHLKYVTDRTIDLDTVDAQGGIVTKNLVISIDPYMRGRMRAPGEEELFGSLRTQSTTEQFLRRKKL